MLAHCDVGTARQRFADAPGARTARRRSAGRLGSTPHSDESSRLESNDPTRSRGCLPPESNQHRRALPGAYRRSPTGPGERGARSRARGVCRALGAPAHGAEVPETPEAPRTRGHGRAPGAGRRLGGLTASQPCPGGANGERIGAPAGTVGFSHLTRWSFGSLVSYDPNRRVTAPSRGRDTARFSKRGGGTR